MMGAPLLLASGLLLHALAVAGGSAVVTVGRMRNGGMAGEEPGDLPARPLFDRSGTLLLSLALASLAGLGLSAAALPGLVAVLGAGGALAGLAAGLGWMLLAALATLLARVAGVSRPLVALRALQPPLWVLLVLGWVPARALARLLERLGPGVSGLEHLNAPLSGEEIRGLLADGANTGLVEGEGVEWARSIFELRQTELSEIMVPRIDMAGMEVETEFAEAVRIAASSRYTRLPVWEGSQDRILGVLHSKDLLAAHARGEAPSIRQLLRPVHFLPESKRIDEALAEFREGRVHLAVVVDEYGGTAGIVTLEDMLEEIVGEIRDEYDQEGELVRVLDGRRAVIDPRVDIDDLNDLLGLELPAEDHDTLGGLLYARLGRVPGRGDSVELEGGLHFTVDRVERQRIRQVTLRSEGELSRPPQAGGQEQGQRA